ncbi:NAD(P)H-binding protein [bacterium]|nr:NAD(P)H-binding protein [bacterium]
MKILMTGGTGHTGERVVRRMLALGHQVRVFTRGSKSGVVAGLVSAGAQICNGDLTESWTLLDAARGCDAIIGCTHVRHAPRLIATCEMMDIRRYIQMSSTRRYTKWPCPTSRDVIAGEAAISRSDLDFTILRATMIFGGSRDANLERLVRWFRKRNWFPIFGDGTNLVQPVFVEDLVNAFEQVVQRGAPTFRRDYTLAGPEPITYESMIRQIAGACGKSRPWLPHVPLGIALAAARVAPPPLVKRGLSAEQIRRFGEDKSADIAPARRELGFAPRSFGEAIRLKVEGKAEVP